MMCPPAECVTVNALIRSAMVEGNMSNLSPREVIRTAAITTMLCALSMGWLLQ